MKIEDIVQGQREYFATGATLGVEHRRRALARLCGQTKKMEGDILDALRQDLGKAPFEGYMTEVGLALQEMRFLRRHLRGWMKDRRVHTPPLHFPARSVVRREPYGTALVMAPWNYPFLLSVTALAGALAAGNCVVLKPSAYAPATGAVLRRLAESCFAQGQVAVVEGGRAQNAALLEQRFDYIFFTGSVEVGKLVMEKAARHLTPVTLELGGKNPCIVDATAHIKTAGRRIAFGKYLNAGQTCVAPDYVLVERSVQQALIDSIAAATHEFFGPDALACANWPRIVNEKHHRRLLGLLQGQRVVFGGTADDALHIAPTLLRDVAPDAAVMQEEIFGPILPVLAYDTMDDAIAFVNAREHPLALYLFTQCPQNERRVLDACRFGGGCVNDTVVHLAVGGLPFGGVGQSGMGAYHGKKSFETFSHEKSILKKAVCPENRVRCHPYTRRKERLLRFFLR